MMKITQVEFAKLVNPQIINNRHQDFSDMNLSGKVFKNVDFSHAKFKGASLDGTQFKECILYNTNFKGATITDTTLFRHNGMRSPIEAKAHFDDKQKEILGYNNQQRAK